MPLGTVGRASNQDARQRNLQAALQCVYRSGAISRAEIARVTGLTRATVSDLVAHLATQGLITEVGLGVSSGGKPPTLLSLNPAGREIVALDLSRRPFRGAIFDLRGAVVRRATGRSGRTGGARLEEVVRLAESLIEAATAPVLGVGIGTPGIVDLQGRVVEASNLGWHGLPLQDELATRFELPIRVANDAHVAALGEFGTRPGTNLALVKVGVGIGAGLMVDGRLYRGDRPAAGEVGHIRVADRGLPCTCGNSGCLETVASVPSIIRQAVAASGRHLDPVSLPWDARHLAGVLGERPVRQAIDRAGRSLGAVIAHLVAILDLHHVAVSLELEHGEEAFLASVADEVRARVLPALASEVEIVASSHGADLVTSGAALLVLSEQLGVVWQ